MADYAKGFFQMYEISRFWRGSLLILASVTMGGCATTSVFNPYPDQALEMKAALVPQPELAEGSPSRIDAVLESLATRRDSEDAMLYMMERGRLAQLASRFAESKQDFELVISRFEESDLASTVQLSRLGEQGASMLTNDNALSYRGAGYERIFVHQHQAFNYWGLGDIEGAAVELRKAGLEQQVLLEKYESDIAEAHAEAAEKDIDLSTLPAEFAGLDTIAGEVKSSFQNAYTFYTSAVFWEATGELDSALVDFKKAYEINPGAKLIQRDIARVSSKLGMPVDSEVVLPKGDEGVVVVLFEEGFVPAKSEIKLPIPMPEGGLMALAFPFYETNGWPGSVALKVQDKAIRDVGETTPIINVGALAVKDLKERIPELLLRQTLRGISKYQLQSQSGEQFGVAGTLLSSIFNVVSESADRRSWLTLPNTAQVLRLHLPAGARELTLSTPTTQQNVTLTVRPNRTTVLRVINVNHHFVPQVFDI